MNNYDQILEIFCRENDLRPEIETPFNYEGTENIYATDSYCLVCIPKRFCENEYETRGKPKVTAVFPEKTIKKPLSVLSLNSALNKIELIEKPIYEECKECYGLQTVEWEYKGHKKYFYCPECDGDGDIKTNKTETVRDTESCIRLDNNYFNGDILDKLAYAANKVGVSEIYLLNESINKKAHLYQVGDIEVLIMPILSKKATVIICE